MKTISEKAFVACVEYAYVSRGLIENQESISHQMMQCSAERDDDYYSCISRSLDWLKKERTEASTRDSYSEVGTLEDCDLCEECSKVLPLLAERKKLRQERGIALRRIIAIGKRTKENKI